MKNEVKKKYQAQRQNANQTGAGPIDIVFSDIDDRIISICQEDLLDGDKNVHEIGFSRSKSPSKSNL